MEKKNALPLTVSNYPSGEWFHQWRHEKFIKFIHNVSAVEIRRKSAYFFLLQALFLSIRWMDCKNKIEKAAKHETWFCCVVVVSCLLYVHKCHGASSSRIVQRMTSIRVLRLLSTLRILRALKKKKKKKTFIYVSIRKRPAMCLLLLAVADVNITSLYNYI